MQRGFTLIELLVVIFIISIIAGVAVPSLSNSDPYHLDLAATEVATALQFARDESIRTAEVHGVYFDRTTTQLVVFKAGTATDPLDGLSVVYHPQTKQLYDLVLTDNPMMRDVSVSNTNDPFSYIDLNTNESHVLFNPQGTPIWKSSGTTYILEDAAIQLVYGELSKTVSLQWGYGRVTIQ